MVGYIILRFVVTLYIVINLVGCVNSAKHGAINPVGEKAESRDDVNEQAKIEPTEPIKKVKPPSLQSRIETKLLAQAQTAFREARYTSPDHDNAYDKFHSVLLLNPDNNQARSGLQAIMLRYAQLIRTALRDGRISSAKNYMRQVEVFYPANTLLMDLKKKITKAQRAIATRVVKEREEQANYVEEIKLSRDDLASKSEEMTRLLAQIAIRLQQTKESVLIFARNDSEGRWIYRQLKSAVQGYRVRGDIRIARSPKIRIMPPL